MSKLLLFILCLAFFFFFFLNLLDDIFVDNTHEAAVSWDSETVIFFLAKLMRCIKINMIYLPIHYF